MRFPNDSVPCRTRVSPLWVGLLFVAISCASGGVAGNGEPCEGADCVDAGSSSFPDAGPVADADTTDAGPMLGFGETCSDRSECASNICLLAGVSGMCTDFCVGDCPEGFGCFGVLDVIEQGEVAEVCVPLSSQLCSPCQLDSECAIVGSDLCLTNADERSFCARDCSNVACPDGYTCSDVEVEGSMFQQCLPESTACDCTASDDGAMETCNIATDFSDCEGARTCGGGAGWGDCQAPSMTDAPDGSFVDANCDGIDGELDAGIFVATNGGINDATCGLVYGTPCRTIAHATVRALQSARGQLYVQAGDYNEIVVLVNGIDIYGGFDTTWQRDIHTDSAHRVTITGSQDNGAGGSGEFLSVRAHNLVVTTVMADLVIVGPNAGGTGALGARSSYALHIDSALVDLQRVSIVAGNGTNAVIGSVGFPTSSAAASTAMTGKIGGNAREFTSDCNDSSHGLGGNAGVNSCGGARNPNAGKGGNGGEMDTDCDCVFGVCVCGPCGATSGDMGANASYTFASFGRGGGSGSGGGSCGATGTAGNGRIQNGSAGTGGGATGLLSGGYWYARPGTSGNLGQNGGGGGGGGGSGGCDDGIDSYGAGGGGGGAGGCAASSSGGGGQGGGGSFGIFVVGGSTLTAADCTIARGSGGAGGQGGQGGHGQRGAGGGNGGLADGDSAAGGAGATGAHGGHGGGGGGGSGGWAVGVYSIGSSVTQSCVISGGSAGTGGNGGLSAPVAPVADRDGNDGNPGANGSLQAVVDL